MTEVVTLGECLVSFVATAPGPLSEASTFERFVAGAEANVAVGLARLGHAVTYIGRVGADGFGDAIRRRLLGEGVRAVDLATDDGRDDRSDVPRAARPRAGPGRLRAPRLGRIAALGRRRRSSGRRRRVRRGPLAAPDRHHAGALRRRPGRDRARDRPRRARPARRSASTSTSAAGCGPTRPPRRSCARWRGGSTSCSAARTNSRS